MSHLAISLLGPFRVTREGEPVARFESDTARALLGYLVMQPGVAHRRETLAGLLWPERSDSEALRNLRVALSRLRDAIGDREAAPPFLHITRKTLQFNADSDYWLDVRTFSDAVAASKAHGHGQLESCASCMAKLEEAAALYGGDFLAGFSLASAPFEGWLVATFGATTAHEDDPERAVLAALADPGGPRECPRSRERGMALPEGPSHAMRYGGALPDVPGLLHSLTCEQRSSRSRGPGGRTPVVAGVGSQDR